jgi:hypothetical protein
MTTKIILVAALVSGAAARADGRIEVGAFGGAHLFSTTSELGSYDYDPAATSPRDAFTFGLRLGVRAWCGLSFEGEVTVASTSARSGTADVDILGARVHALWTFMRGRRVQPFVLAGVGLMGLSTSNPDVLHEDFDGETHVGAGARIAIRDNWGARAEARLLVVPSTQGSSFTEEGELFAGVYATFGAAPKPAPPPTSEPASAPAASAPTTAPVPASLPASEPASAPSSQPSP